MPWTRRPSVRNGARSTFSVKRAQTPIHRARAQRTTKRLQPLRHRRKRQPNHAARLERWQSDPRSVQRRMLRRAALRRSTQHCGGHPRDTQPCARSQRRSNRQQVANHQRNNTRHCAAPGRDNRRRALPQVRSALPLVRHPGPINIPRCAVPLPGTKRCVRSPGRSVPLREQAARPPCSWSRAP
jgi:hypothetical protein